MPHSTGIHKEDRMNNSMKIQAVLNTLETLTMAPTYDNSNKMLGIYRTLMEVRDDEHEREEKETGTETDAG